MASLIHPECDSTFDYRGLESIFEYCNQDGTLVRTNCGQCAAATFLTYHHRLEQDVDRARAILAEIESRYPPDNVAGLFGTSRRRVTLICRAHGLKVEPVEGEEALRDCLARDRPVIVMLGVSGGRFWRFDLPGGHWMVAYGYDSEFVYLTNHGRMTWDRFRAGWQAVVPRLISMQRRGLVLARPSASGD
jgi:hypothetical protein